MRKPKNERGGVLIWSVIMMTAILAVMSLAVEMFRVGSALSQQRDSAQFAAEAALSDARACIASNWPPDMCRDRAAKIATAVIEKNKLVGIALANSASVVTVKFYNCEPTNDDSCYTGTGAGCAREVTNFTATDFNNVKTRMARVVLSGGAFDSIINIVGKVTFALKKGEGTAYFKYANPSSGESAKINYISFDRVRLC